MAKLNDLFEQAQNEVNELSERPSNSDLLKLYALYKQGSQGDASGKRPGMLDVKGRAKYDAWYGYSGMDVLNAKQAYIDLVNKLKE